MTDTGWVHKSYDLRQLTKRQISSSRIPPEFLTANRRRTAPAAASTFVGFSSLFSSLTAGPVILILLTTHFQEHAMVKRLMIELRAWITTRTDVHYTSVPIWTPWRDS
jgi:hypothetical protein